MFELKKQCHPIPIRATRFGSNLFRQASKCCRIDKVSHKLLDGLAAGLLQRIALANMTKRKRPGDDEQQPPSKRIRSETFCQLELSKLSDELVLKTLTYLPIEDLAVVQRCVISFSHNQLR
jgi:hypothetical protein